MLLTQSNADSVPLSKTLKTTTEHPFRFFDLPQELRDKIFHLVCTSNPTMISSPYPLAGLSDSDAIRYIRVQYRQQEDSTDANEYQFPA